MNAFFICIAIIKIIKCIHLYTIDEYIFRSRTITIADMLCPRECYLNINKPAKH